MFISNSYVEWWYSISRQCAISATTLLPSSTWDVFVGKYKNIFSIISKLGLGYTYIRLKYQSKENTLITGSNYREYIYWVHFLPVDNIKIS